MSSNIRVINKPGLHGEVQRSQVARGSQTGHDQGKGHPPMCP